MRCSRHGDCTHPYAHYARETIKKQKMRAENLLDVSPRFLPSRTSECSLLSNIIYGFGEINIKNRKGKTTARTIKKLVVKVREARGSRAAQSPRRAATLPLPALRPPLPSTHYAALPPKGLGRLTLTLTITSLLKHTVYGATVVVRPCVCLSRGELISVYKRNHSS